MKAKAKPAKAAKKKENAEITVSDNHGQVKVSDLAKDLKISPKRLRAIMRANGMSAKGGHYAWDGSDAKLSKIAGMVVQARESKDKEKK